MIVGNRRRAFYSKERQSTFLTCAGFAHPRLTRSGSARRLPALCVGSTRFLPVCSDTSCAVVPDRANRRACYPVENASSLSHVAKKSVNQLL
jgi:hypothetical protein